MSTINSAKGQAANAMDKGREAVDKGRDAMDKVKDAGQSALNAAGDLASAAGQKAGDLASQAGQKAGDYARAAGQKADDLASQAGQRVQSAADAVRQHGPQDGMLGSATRAVADTVDQAGRYLQQEGVSGMMDDVTEMIRRNPVPALLVGIGIGYLLGRVMDRS